MWKNGNITAPLPFDGKGYIENQEEWGGIPFGWHPGSDLAKTGCGVFAAWNALVAAHRTTEVNGRAVFAELVSGFERFGAVFGGRLGVSVAALFFYVCRHFRHARICVRHNRYLQNAFGVRSDVVITTIVNNRRKLMNGLHTVCITKDDAGFVVHNAYRRNREGKWCATRAYSTLSEALADITPDPFFVVMIGADF